MKYVFKKKSLVFLFAILDFIGSALTFPFKLFGKRFPNNIRNILIIRLDHIGDVISSSSIPRNLKNYYPNAKLTFLASSSMKEILANNPYVDAVICYNAPWFARNKKTIFDLKTFSNLVRTLRKNNYDLGFDLRGDFRHIIIMTLAGIKFRVGYGITAGGFLLHREAKYYKNAHIINRNLQLLKILGIPIISNSIELYFKEEDKAFVDNLLKEIKYNREKAVVVHPYAGTKAKEWEEEKFRDLIRALKQKGWDTFIVGTKEDKENYDSSYDLRGKLSVSQLAYLIKCIGFFIGLDSGPANIAAGLNIPTLVICSGTNISQNWIPKADNIRFVFRDVECKPCEFTVCPKKRHSCMEEITVEEVISMINNLIPQV